jgi:hypothetical protein
MPVCRVRDLPYASGSAELRHSRALVPKATQKGKNGDVVARAVGKKTQYQRIACSGFYESVRVTPNCQL